MSNYNENEDVWSNEILEEDDEKTIKLKQRLNRAEAELDIVEKEVEEKKDEHKKNHFNFKQHKKEKKHSSLISNQNAKGLSKFGYDEQAHQDMKNGKGYVDNLIESKKMRMTFYIGISVVCISLVIAKIFFL